LKGGFLLQSLLSQWLRLLISMSVSSMVLLLRRKFMFSLAALQRVWPLPALICCWACMLCVVLVNAKPANAGVYQLEENGSFQRIDQQIAPTADNVQRAYTKRAAVRTRAKPRARSIEPAAKLAARAQYFAPIVNQAAQAYGLSPALVHAVAHTESRYNQNALSHANAIGIMQLMPGTARDLGVNPHDPVQNIYGGAAYLRLMLNQFNGNLIYALAAYNAGPGAVVRAGGVPPYQETTRYVASVLDKLAQSQ
jgi:soluble lytic murein transglycosylase-like protein